MDLVALIHFLACSIGGVRLRDSNKKTFTKVYNYGNLISDLLTEE